MLASMPTDSAELVQIAAEARDIARNVGQPPGTQHLLLATFTVPGPADALLRERGCDEDRVLQELSKGAKPEETAEAFSLALDRARQLASDCGHSEAGGLHLLVALTRLTRSSAAQLLERALDLATLRTTALGYLTGAIPRRREGAAILQTPRAAVVTRNVATQPSAAPLRVATVPPQDLPVLEERKPAPAEPQPPRAPRPGELDAREYPFLATYGRNLTALALEEKLDAAVGREREIEELLD